jgi:hypothetical protein
MGDYGYVSCLLVHKIITSVTLTKVRGEIEFALAPDLVLCAKSAISGTNWQSKMPQAFIRGAGKEGFQRGPKKAKPRRISPKLQEILREKCILKRKSPAP